MLKNQITKLLQQLHVPNALISLQSDFYDPFTITKNDKDLYQYNLC